MCYNYCRIIPKGALPQGRANNKMKLICNKTFDEERALYGSRGVIARSCAFDGPADGESAFKESCDVEATDCLFNLRYPFWHDSRVRISNCEMTPLCRAALWYCDGVEIENSKLFGIKALRECRKVNITKCDVVSAEFGWFSSEIKMTDCTAESEYFMLRGRDLSFSGLKMKGKYSFQYIENSTFENCVLDTKDAFWHAKNVTVRNSTVKGEYLGWYCENVTFENCIISGTQPLCYCKGLKLINCEMHGTDLSFERSDVLATLTTPVISIKNPYSGKITLPSADELIIDDPCALCEIELIGDK